MSDAQILVEPRTRYDLTFRYALHDAYFQSRGIAAWTENEIPHEITTNIGTARQHARLLVAHFLAREAELEGGPYGVLEIGGGLGRFAGNLLRALDGLAATDAAAQRLSERLVYLFSDVSPVSVEQAASAPDLAPHVEAGRVLPVVFDVRTPDQVTTLSGDLLEAPLHAVIANYLVCTTPMRLVQRAAPALWREAYGSLWVPNHTAEDEPTPEADEIRASYLDDPIRVNAIQELEAKLELEPVDPAAELGADHAAILEALLSPYPVGTVAYPISFIECMTHLARRMGPGGLFALTDLARGEASELDTDQLPQPLHYGNTLNHVVNFGLFDAVGEALGWSVQRTRGYLPSVHQAVLVVDQPLPEPVAQSFQAHVIEHHEGHELLDVTEAALDAVKAEAYHRALRFFEKAVAIDPTNARLRYQYGETCVHCGLMVLARDQLNIGMALDPENKLDFDFLLGRVYAALDDTDAALEQLFHSLAKTWHPVTLTNIGEVYRQANNFGDAYRYYRLALLAEPEHEHAQKRLDSLRDEWWLQHNAPLEAAAQAEHAARPPSQ